MLNLLSNLTVKDLYFSQLLQLPVYERDLTFYTNLADALGKESEAAYTDTQQIGLLSELIYLYSLLHFSVEEVTGEDVSFRTSLQMPVLLGDLLLGRFYEAMAECNKEDCLDYYVNYIRDFSAKQIDAIDAGVPTDASIPHFVFDMAEVTVQSVLKYSKNTDEAALRSMAEQYVANHWVQDKGMPVTTAEQAEALLKERA